MAPSEDEWLSKAWSEYTQKKAPWVKEKKTAIAVLVAPLLAVFSAFAGLIETWSEALVINPLTGVWEFGVDLVQVVFRGQKSFPDAFEGGTFGFIRALNVSWRGILDFVGGLGLPAFPLGVAVALAFAYLLGRVINRG